MKRLSLAALLLTLAAPLPAQESAPSPDLTPAEHPAQGKPRPSYANPSAVIATELAFARAAQDKGQWTAFLEFADKDATMFAPGPVNAKQWLKGRRNPAQAMRWQPHQVLSSCDGSLAVTSGAWQRADGKVGSFTTVWKRQKAGEYRWVLDHGDTLNQPPREPEMIRALVADCQPPDPSRRASPEPREGATQVVRKTSDGGSLSYEYAVWPNGQLVITATMWRDGREREVLAALVYDSARSP